MLTLMLKIGKVVPKYPEKGIEKAFIAKKVVRVLAKEGIVLESCQLMDTLDTQYQTVVQNAVDRTV